MKNIFQRAEDAKKSITDRFDLRFSDIHDLAGLARDVSAPGLYETISVSYLAGFEAGVRFLKSKQRKERKEG